MSNNKGEKTGRDVNYYIVPVPSPKRLEPYVAECEDIIEALGMTFSEGNEFKAIWRSCAARTLGTLKEGMDEDGIYDAEKQVYYAGRTLVIRKSNRAKRIKLAETVIVQEDITGLPSPAEIKEPNQPLKVSSETKPFLSQDEVNCLLNGRNGDGSIRTYDEKTIVNSVLKNAEDSLLISLEDEYNIEKCLTCLFTSEERLLYKTYISDDDGSSEGDISSTDLQKAVVMGLHGTTKQQEEARLVLNNFDKSLKK